MLFPEDSEDGTLEDGFTTHSSSFERIHNYEGDMEVQVRTERERERGRENKYSCTCTCTYMYMHMYMYSVCTLLILNQ